MAPACSEPIKNQRRPAASFFAGACRVAMGSHHLSDGARTTGRSAEMEKKSLPAMPSPGDFGVAVAAERTRARAGAAACFRAEPSPSRKGRGSRRAARVVARWRRPARPPPPTGPGGFPRGTGVGQTVPRAWRRAAASWGEGTPERDIGAAADAQRTSRPEGEGGVLKRGGARRPAGSALAGAAGTRPLLQFPTWRIRRPPARRREPASGAMDTVTSIRTPWTTGKKPRQTCNTPLSECL